MYQIIMMLLVPLQFFTGLLLWDVKRFSAMVDLFGGVRVVDTIHVLLFIVFSGFIIVHVYLASLGHTPSAHFKAMITGYEEVEDDAGRGGGSGRRVLTHDGPTAATTRAPAARAWGLGLDAPGSASSSSPRCRAPGCCTSSSAPGNWRAACRFPRRCGSRSSRCA